MIVKINKETQFNVSVSTSGGRIQSSNPITVKNQFREYQINSIQDLPDITETQVVNGASLVYNSSLNQYEVKPLTTDFITGAIDAGEF